MTVSAIPARMCRRSSVRRNESGRPPRSAGGSRRSGSSPRAMVDREFPADPGVHLPDERGRHVHVAHAAHIAARHPPAEVVDHAAAEGHDDVAAAELPVGRASPQPGACSRLLCPRRPARTRPRARSGLREAGDEPRPCRSATMRSVMTARRARRSVRQALHGLRLGPRDVDRVGVAARGPPSTGRPGAAGGSRRACSAGPPVGVAVGIGSSRRRSAVSGADGSPAIGRPVDRAVSAAAAPARPARTAPRG